MKEKCVSVQVGEASLILIFDDGSTQTLAADISTRGGRREAAGVTSRLGFGKNREIAAYLDMIWRYCNVGDVILPMPKT